MAMNEAESKKEGVFWFSPQEVGYLQFRALYFWFAKKKPEEPMYHIKIVCESDYEYLGFRQGYQRFVLEMMNRPQMRQYL